VSERDRQENKTNKERVMGDRANIEIREGEKSFFFYSHWGGCDLPKTLQEGLSLGRPRWDDHPYLSRIIFCRMIRDNVDELTGFGISAERVGDEYDVLAVDMDEKKVIVGDYSWTFSEYCEISDISWEKLEQRGL
jgi:hypothetical protein